MNGWYGLLAFLIGFVLAQLWKFITGVLTRHDLSVLKRFKIAIGYMMQTGGMPSGHTASMTALTTYIGFATGFNSGLFALAVATTCIIMYDALHVRYAVGEQGKALNKLLERAKEPVLPVVKGHKVSEVFVGLLLGVIIGGFVFYILG